MTNLSDHHSSHIVKLLYIGDSGTGKTGSLTSLVKAGYKLRILDCDNGLDPLVQFVMRDCPDKLTNVEYETRREKFKASPAGPIISGSPRAFVDCLELLTKWADGTTPAEWGGETILVIDTFSGLSTAAFEWAKGMNPSAKDPRQWYFMAQQALEKVIDMLTGSGFACNVIVISHIDYKEREDGITKGYARAVGSALGPIIPKYFNTVLLCETKGMGTKTQRMIKTLPTGVVDLKTPAPFRLNQDLPLDTGLAVVFEALKRSAVPTQTPK